MSDWADEKWKESDFELLAAQLAELTIKGNRRRKVVRFRLQDLAQSILARIQERKLLREIPPSR